MPKFLSKSTFKAGSSFIYSFLMYLSIVFVYQEYLQQQRISRMIAILFLTRESQRRFEGNAAPFYSNIFNSKKLFSSLSSIRLLFYFSLTLKYFCINDEYIINNTHHFPQLKHFQISEPHKLRSQFFPFVALQSIQNSILIIQMSELKFRINSVTSQHPKYPAGNLVLGQQGWQSVIDCEYPQSITIQFFVPIKTKKMHLLFHHYKIPKIVQVFVKLGAKGKYKKVGYVVPNDNTQSSFREKQEKVLYFEYSCTHIRLIFYQNFKNDRNLFNQVALDDLNLFGEIISNRDLIGVDLTEEESSDQDVTASLEVSHNARADHLQAAAVPQGNQNNLAASSSPLFSEIYEKLQYQKQIAVEREDYQKAANLKKVLLSFQQLEEEINKMQFQKQQALELEDYDRCHKLKHYIALKKQIVQFQKQQLFQNEQNFYSQHSISRVVQDEAPIMNESKRQDSPKQLRNFRSPEVDKIKASAVQANQSIRYDQQVVPALLHKNKPDNLPLQTTQKRKQLNDYNQYSIPNQPNEAQNPPTKREALKGNQKQSEYASKNQSNIFQLQQLDNKLRLRVETYFSFIPQKIWQLCENKNWKAKQQALKFLKQKLPDVIIKEHFMGVIEMVSRIMTSKQATISIQALHIINKLADIKIKFVLQHMPFFVEQILSELLNFLNDTNKQIKQLAYTTYLKLPEISFLGLSIVIKEVIKHKNKVKNDPKLLITKLQLTTALLQRYGNMEFPHKEIILWILNGIEDPNQKVRAQAQETLYAVTFLLGSEKILKIVESSRPNMLQNLVAVMNASFQHSKIQNQQQSKLSLDNSKLHQQFYGFEQGKQSKVQNISNIKQPQKHIDNPIYLLQQQPKSHKMQQSKHSRQQNANVDLSYSKQSVFEQSIQSNNISLGYDKQLEGDQGEDQFKECEYCLEEYQVRNQKNHYVNECKVIAYCQRCNGYIYIRQFTSHLLTECEDNHLFIQCKKCGIAVELEEKNEHIGRDICKNRKGVNWERCQFCFQDVLAQDKFWIKHAKQCKHLPAKMTIGYEDELSHQQSVNS